MKELRRMAFFGSSLTSAYWNGAATYYRGIISNLHQLGFSVTFYEPDAYGRQEHRDISEPPWARVVVYQGAGKDGVEKALEEAASADIIVKASGVGVFDELLEKAVLEVRRPGAKAIFWDVDAPATLERVEGNANDPFRPLIPRYDLILTYGGGPPVVDGYRALGARDCIPIYNALDPATHYPVEPNERYKCDLGFLGNRMPDREERVREFFFRAARELPGRKFTLGGNGWETAGASNIKYLGHVYTKEHNAFNSSSLAILNVNRASMARYGYSPPTRIFEAAGAGACIITDKWDGIELFLEPGREILVAKDGLEVAELLKTLTPERAASIGSAAYRRILSGHTYAHRASQLLPILNSEQSDTP